MLLLSELLPPFPCGLRNALSASLFLVVAASADPAGLVAHWSMNEARGTLLPDASGNEHHATARYVTLVKGVDGAGVAFDGMNSNLGALTGPELELRDALTLEGWVRPQTATMGGFPSVIRKDAAYALRFSDRTLGFLLWMKGQIKTLSTKPRTWQAGTWYHVAATYDGENMRLYVDGEEAPNSPMPMTGKIDVVGSTCGIGSARGQYVLNGTLDDVRIYSRALAAGEIKQSEQKGRAALRAQVDVDVEPVAIGENRPVFRKPEREVQMVEDGFLWIDAEDFADYGGWTLDTQFVHLMGSGFLLATGIGKPVRDAVTMIDIPAEGTYRVWVRARNWVREHAPGQFQVLVNGTALDMVFGGANSDKWVWESGGNVRLSAGATELAIHDLTGYYGRCDAIILTTDMNYTPPPDREGAVKERARLTGLSLAPTDVGTFDVIVVGAGSAGCPAAIAAARMGAKTALIQNRPVLGGNSSSECGVPLNGAGALKPNAREGGIAAEVGRIRARYGYRKYSESFTMLADAEPNLTVFTNRHVFDVMMDGPQRIAGVKAVDTLTGAITTYRGTQFIDCTGDGWVGYFAKAEYRLGRESKHEFGEDLAPEKADTITMSGCIMGNALGFRAVSIGEPAPYTPPSWAPKLPPKEEFGRNVRRVAGGEWWMEHPGTVDDIWDAEFARDELIRISFGYWDFIKNESPLKEQAETFVLSVIPYMDAKRESRRLVGDYMLNQNDVLSARVFEDRISYGGWPLDIHHPKGIFSGREGPFDYNTHTPLYTIPYRCLYSKNIDNLLFAGRCSSVTHVALGSIRVQSTLSTLGQAVGTAAAMCIRHSTTPRGVYRDYTQDLQQELVKQDQYIPGVPNRDPRDLARKAKVTASSTASFTLFSKRNIQKDDLHPMTTDRTVSFPTQPGQQIDRIELLLKSDLAVPLSLTLHPRAGENPVDFSSTKDILTATAEVPPKREGWVSFDINHTVSSPALHVWIPATEGLHWRLMTNAPSGCHRAYGRATSADWTVVESQRYAFCTEPALQIPTTVRASNVNNGWSRIIGDESNMWASDPMQPMPQWVELDFGEEVELNTVHLTFDTNMDTKWPNVPIPQESVRDYRVSWHNGRDWVTATEEKGNFVRHRIHRFETVRASRLRVTIEATNGSPSARIFEVRAYREE